MIKKILGLFALVLFSSIYSCSSDDDGNNTPSSSITASIGSDSFSGVGVASVSEFGFDNITMLQIIAVTRSQSTLTMQLPVSSLREGTFTFSGEDATGNLTYMPSISDFNIYSSAETGGSFTVTITDFDVAAGTLSGSFSASLKTFGGEGGDTIVITNGSINAIPVTSTNFYSNGTMGLSLNGGTPFTMDDDQNDGRFLTIAENSTSNTITIFGYNTAQTSDFGVFNLNFPKNITPGTYAITANGNYTAGFSNSETTEYSVNSGSLTITSHTGKVVVGTFNFNAVSGTQTANISNGNFSITHN